MKATDKLLEAMRENDLQAVRKALDSGSDPRTKYDDSITPLHFAAQNGQHDIARLLIERGAEATSRNRAGDTPSDLAAKHGHIDLAKKLDEVAKGGALGKVALQRLGSSEMQRGG
jgi:ankyrin repeat protein